MNYINWTLVIDMEEIGAKGSLGMSTRLEMYGLRHARHLYLQVLHAHDNCQLGNVCPMGWFWLYFRR